MNLAAPARDPRRANEHAEFSRGTSSNWTCEEAGFRAISSSLRRRRALFEPIGEWVLCEACRQCRAWQVEGIALPCLAVNLSARQFRQRGFVERLATIVDGAEIAPQWLELENTESLLLDANSGVSGMFDELRALGKYPRCCHHGRGDTAAGRTIRSRCRSRQTAAAASRGKARIGTSQRREILRPRFNT